MDYSHPLATVIECNREKSIIRTRIHLDRVERFPISPASLWIGDPPKDIDAQVIFSLHRLIARDDQLFSFETFEEFQPQSPLPSMDSTYRFVTWWMPDQLALAQSNPDNLHRYLFVPKSLEDHDHCFLCWKEIYEHEGNDHEAYTNGYDSICFACFDKYITSGFGKLLGDAA